MVVEVSPETVVKLFWEKKGIVDPNVLVTAEKRAFVEELRSFRDGFNAHIMLQQQYEEKVSYETH